MKKPALTGGFFRAACRVGQTWRAAIICLISPIACAGFRPFGQVRAQFMIVWQR